MAEPLNETEMAYFDTILDKAETQDELILTRMLLEGREVAVVMSAVYNRFNPKVKEGYMALAILIDPADLHKLSDPGGSSGVSFSPYEVI